MLLENTDGWLFPEESRFENHIIDVKGIEELLHLAEIEDEWTRNVWSETVYHDKHPSKDILVDELRILNAPGTVKRYPFNLAFITFPSRRHLFRGELGVYEKSLPTFNRKHVGETEDIRVLWKAVADMRAYQFYKFIWNFNIVPYWEAKLSDVNIKALAQHYGFETCLLDFTNDVRTALFFALCKYIPKTDSYRPLNETECKEKKYGVIYHTPDWTIDYFQPMSGTKIFFQSQLEGKTEFKLDNGDLDGIAFQIGMQPLMRCHHQSGYVFPMYYDMSISAIRTFEKIYIPLTTELSNRIFELMDKGKKVFPNEGINEVRNIIDEIKQNVIFSTDDLKYAFYEQTKYTDFHSFKNEIENYDYNGHKIILQEDEVKYFISKEKIDEINAKYDDINLLEPTGGMMHAKPEEIAYRKNRCIQIYGKEI